MRREFIANPFLSRKEVKAIVPWAAMIVRVDGGYLAFESLADFGVWKNQK